MNKPNLYGSMNHDAVNVVAIVDIKESLAKCELKTPFKVKCIQF